MAMPDPQMMMQAMGGANQPGTPPAVPMGGDPSFQDGMASLNGLMPGGDSAETTAMTKAQEALDLAHKLVLNVLPLVNQWNPELAKTLHAVGKQLVDVQTKMMGDQTVGMPPAMLSGSMQVPGGA